MGQRKGMVWPGLSLIGRAVLASYPVIMLYCILPIINVLVIVYMMILKYTY